VSTEHDEALGHWRGGRTLEAGKLIFESLPRDGRPKWAADILRAVVKRTGLTSPPIERILRIAADPDQWKEGHEVFDEARDQTLQLEAMAVRSPREDLMLRQILLAELVAKVLYNATDPPDEFDEDSGWWIASCLWDVIEAVGDDDFAASMWVRLSSGGDRSGVGTSSDTKE
jgi:hypothetical protein